MMVIALILLWLELKIFDRLFVPRETTRPAIFTMPYPRKPEVARAGGKVL
jgi:hypothetical protein